MRPGAKSATTLARAAACQQEAAWPLSRSGASWSPLAAARLTPAVRPYASPKPARWRVRLHRLQQTTVGAHFESYFHWVHSSVVRAADCRSAGPWLKSRCALVTPYHNSAAALLCCIRLRFFQSRRYAARPASGLPPKGARLWPQRWLWWARSETTLAWATASQLKAARPPGPERRKLVAAGRGPTYTRSATMRIA